MDQIDEMRRAARHARAEDWPAADPDGDGAEAGRSGDRGRARLGLDGAQIDAFASRWRAGMDPGARVELAAALWDSDIHEARIVAAKLLTQARIKDDGAVWALICSWVPQTDGIPVSDAVMAAGARRLVARPERLDEIARWRDEGDPWVRRAWLAGVRPWAKMASPKAGDLARRAAIVAALPALAADPARPVQKALADWLADLSRRDPAAVRAFLLAHGEGMAPFARQQAGRRLQDL